MSKKVVNEDENEVNGIKGQIIYPDRVVDAERAGAYAAGKVDTLDPDATLPEANPHRIQGPEEIESRDYDTVVNEDEDDDEGNKNAG